MKLSKAQIEVLNTLSEQIRKARECKNLNEWIEKHSPHYKRYINTNKFGKELKEKYNYVYEVPEDSVENYTKTHYLDYELDKKWYHNNFIGTCLVSANTRTIKKLADLGYIEIIKIGADAPDTVKLLKHYRKDEQ